MCIFILYVFVILVLCLCCCFTLDAGLLARSPYPASPATGHLDTGFSWFPCVYKRMLSVTELYSGETCSVVTQFVECKKMQLELWKDVEIEFGVEIYLRNYKFCV